MDAAPAPVIKVKKARGLAGSVAIIIGFAAGAAAGGAGAAIGLMKFAPPAAAARPAPAEHDEAKTATEYIEIDNAFTSNLIDTGRYLQIRIAVATEGGPPVAAAIVKHKPAIISAVLAALGELGEADIAGRVAKDRLRGRVRVAINDVLSRKAGLSGVSEVFIVSLVVQ